MNRAVLVLLFLLLAMPASAQTGDLAGVVLDEEGLPIPGAHVFLEDAQLGTVSSADGSFRLQRVPAGIQRLVASAVGFDRRSLEVDVVPEATTRVTFVLSESTLQQGEVVVTALRRPAVTALVPVSVSVLTSEELEARNAFSLDAGLRYASGVQVAENQVSVRGSSGFSYNVGSRVLLLVDGVPMLGPETGGIPFDAIPMAQVQRVEVVKGPGSALYGSGALGGVINVITRDFPARPETSVRLFGGVHDPVRHESWLQGWPGEAEQYRPLGGISITHARRAGSRAGGWLHLAYRRDRGYMNYSQDEVLQAYGKIGIEPGNRLSLRILGGVTSRERDTFLYWNGLDDVLNPGNLDLLAPGSSDVTGANDNRSIQLSILPSLRHSISPDLFHSVRLRYFLVQIRPIDESGKSRPLEEGTTGFRFGGEWQLDWSLRERRYLTLGLSADANAARSDFFRAGERGLVVGQPEFGAFLQYEQGLGERLNVLAGLRFDAYQIDTTTTTSKLGPKLSASYTLTPSSTLRASYGQGFRVPGIAERYIDNQDFFPFFPNFRLRPEESTGYEVGIRLDGDSRVLRRWSLDGAFFWSDYRHLVEPSFVTDLEASASSRLGFQFVNLTRARIRGAELVADALLPLDLTLRAGYTYLDAHDLTEDMPLAFRSRHLLKVAAELPLAGGLRIGIDYRGASSPERVDTDFARFVPDADVAVPIHVFDARITYDWSRLSAGLLVMNALDYYYVERPAYLAPPRHYVLQLRANL